MGLFIFLDSVVWKYRVVFFITSFEEIQTPCSGVSKILNNVVEEGKLNQSLCDANLMLHGMRGSLAVCAEELDVQSWHVYTQVLVCSGWLRLLYGKGCSSTVIFVWLILVLLVSVVILVSGKGLLSSSSLRKIVEDHPHTVFLR